MKSYNVCSAFKTVWHKLYKNFQSLPVLTDQQKNLLMNFLINLPNLTNWKKNHYDFIPIIVDKLIKMVYYKLIKITINISKLFTVIIDVVIWHLKFQGMIVTNKSSFFTSKFQLLLFYFISIKQMLSTAFFSQTNN